MGGGQFSLKIMIRGQLSSGQFFSVAIIIEGNCPGGIIQETFIWGEAVTQGALFFGDNCVDTKNYHHLFCGCFKMKTNGF